MKRLHRSFLATWLLCGLGGPAAALPDDPRDQARAFATCVGVYSALTREPDGARWSARDPDEARALFELLLSSVRPDAEEHGLTAFELYDYLVAAREHQVRLIREAGAAASHSPRAAGLARQNLRLCETLVS